MAGFAKNAFIIIVTVVIVVLVMQYVVPGLKNITGGVVCDAPYIRHAEGCCLDVTENKICDTDESMVVVKSEEETAAPAEDEEEETQGEKMQAQ